MAFWPALPSVDRLLVPVPPPPEYLAYLAETGWSLPTFGVESDRDMEMMAFGWNNEAARRNLEHRQPASHSSPDIVATVNSREFSFRAERELFPDQDVLLAQGAYCSDAAALTHWLRQGFYGGWVAKGNQGFSGIGQIRFDLETAPRDLAERLLRLLQSRGGLVLEPRQDVQTEFGVLFWIRRDGSMTAWRAHRLFTNAMGKFTGCRRLREDREMLRWQGNIDAAVAAVGNRLIASGYFGPVGIDMYVWNRHGVEHFRPLVDLNARCTMAYALHGLGQRWPDRAIEVSQWPTQELRLPARYPDLKQCLGDWSFNPNTRQGALLLTPLDLGLHRHSLAFFGKDETDLERIRAGVIDKLHQGEMGQLRESENGQLREGARGKLP